MHDKFDLLKKIGRTPLIELKSYSQENVRVFAKLEWFNPYGSVKDRPAYWMIKDAERRGFLNKNKIIIEPTSGNTGISLASIGRTLGYKVEIVLPESANQSTKNILKKLGAIVHEIRNNQYQKVGSGTDQAIEYANEIVTSRPDKYYMPNQFKNNSNSLAHYESTGPEICEQLNGKVSHFFSGIGTGGTVCGAGTYLKHQNPGIIVIGIQAQKDHLLHGLRNFEESCIPAIYSQHGK